MFFHTVIRASAKLIEGSSSFGHADHGDFEMSSFDHRLQRRKDLLVCEVAGGAEENECV